MALHSQRRLVRVFSVRPTSVAPALDVTSLPKEVVVRWAALESVAKGSDVACFVWKMIVLATVDVSSGSVVVITVSFNEQGFLSLPGKQNYL